VKARFVRPPAASSLRSREPSAPAAGELSGASGSLSSDSVDRNCLFVQVVGVIVGVVGVALWLWRSFASDSDRQSAHVGEWIAKIGFATTAAASWLRSHHAKWLRETPRPGGLPMLNAEAKRQPVWLLGYSMVVAYFAMLAMVFAVGLFSQAFGWNAVDSKWITPWTTIFGALSILLTSAYALIVARRRQTTTRASWIDAAVLLPALIALLSSVLLILSNGRPIETSTRGRVVEVAVACASVLVAGIYAMAIANKLKPRDKWGRAESTGWFTGDKRHA
jgi:cation transport ATPase